MLTWLLKLVYYNILVFSQRSHDKKDIYNLNEEEELTHYGQSLAEIEKFNDAVGSDEETEEKGLLSGVDSNENALLLSLSSAVLVVYMSSFLS